MLTVGIMLIIGITIGIIWSIYENDSDIIFPTVVCFGCIGIIVAVCLNTKKCEKSKEYPILSLNDVSSIKGDFYLGCGHIDGSMVYTFYYKNGKDIIGGTLDWDNAVIRESSNSHYLKVVSTVKTDDLINKFAIDLDDDVKKYYIYVPKGTIKQDFVLDAN
jgi:hypothetical protein